MDYEQRKRKEENEDKRERKQINSDYATTFNSIHGRRVLNHLLGLCGIYSNSFTGNSTTFFNEGKRDIGLRILERIMEADKRIYIEALKELNNI